MATHPTLRVAAPVVFGHPDWQSLSRPLEEWGAGVARSLEEAFPMVLLELDPARAWRALLRGDDVREQGGFAGFQHALQDAGADDEFLRVLDRLLYHPLKKVVQCHVEDHLDPEHVYTIGSQLAGWVL